MSCLALLPPQRHMHENVHTDTNKVYSLDLFEPGEEFRALQKFNPNRSHYLHYDITSEGSVTSVVDQIVAQSGRIDGMIADENGRKECVN